MDGGGFYRGRTALFWPEVVALVSKLKDLLHNRSESLWKSEEHIVQPS